MPGRRCGAAAAGCIQGLREQLGHLRPYLLTCSAPKTARVQALLPNMEALDAHKFSMRELVEVNSGAFAEAQTAAVKELSTHVLQCVVRLRPMPPSRRGPEAQGWVGRAGSRTLGKKKNARPAPLTNTIPGGLACCCGRDVAASSAARRGSFARCAGTRGRCTRSRRSWCSNAQVRAVTDTNDTLARGPTVGLGSYATQHGVRVGLRGPDQAARASFTNHATPVLRSARVLAVGATRRPRQPRTRRRRRDARAVLYIRRHPVQTVSHSIHAHTRAYACTRALAGWDRVLTPEAQSRWRW